MLTIKNVIAIPARTEVVAASKITASAGMYDAKLYNNPAGDKNIFASG